MRKKFFIIVFIYCIITGGKLILSLVKSRDLTNDNIIILNSQKDIMFNNFSEVNFTCTGMTYDTKDNTIWIADYGTVNKNGKLKPRLVKINFDFTKIIEIITLDKLINKSFNLQGISYDRLHDSLWLATGDYVYEIDKNGNILSYFSMGKYSKYKANGIAVDKDNIWILCYKKYLIKYDRKGMILKRYKFNYQNQDQIFLLNNKIYCTVGADYLGKKNYVVTFDISTERITKIYNIQNSHSVEGIIIKDNRMYIANDGLYHNDIIGYSYINIYSIK